MEKKVVPQLEGINRADLARTLESELVLSEDSSSPKSIDSEYSYDTTESSLDDDQHARSYMSSDESCESRLSPQSSIVDGLLNEIYDRYHHSDRVVDSDNITECSTTSVFSGSFELDDRTERWTRSQLLGKDVKEIRRVADEMSSYVNLLSGKLVRQLKRRDKNAYRLQRNFDVLTAILQAVSLKRRVDTKIKFSFIPQNGKKGFKQWLHSFKAVSRLPDGVPGPWRKRLWLILAESKLGHIDWTKTCQFCFNERSNPDDDNLGAQIVKDLHRTGCSWFCEFDTPEERAVLKRVLLAYARWNKTVGYCQGFNVIAALILQVMERSEEDALKVMVYLVDFVLPANYFSNNLRSLSVDMAVLRELMKIKLPDLSDHFESLQKQASLQNHTGTPSYEPPLANVFTMQWFLTLFATCLPEDVVLRVWDSILLEGSEVLLRVALAIWAAIGRQLEDLESSDEFYGAMGRILPEIQEGVLIDGTSLMGMVYNMAPFPFPKIVELREKYTYNIRPLASNVSPDKKSKVSKKMKEGYASSDDEDNDMDQMNIGCLGLLAPQAIAEANATREHGGGPKTYQPQVKKGLALLSPAEVSALQKQYDRTRKLQQQAVVVFSQGNAKKSQDLRDIPPAINHLFVVTRARRSKWKAHARKEREQTLRTVREDDEGEQRVNEHLTHANEHLVGLFKGESDVSRRDSSHESATEPQALSVAQEGLHTSFGRNTAMNTYKQVRKKPPKTSLGLSPADPSFVIPDKKSVYPAKFTPFPGNRVKQSKKALLLGIKQPGEATARKESFIGSPPLPPPEKGNR